MRPKDADPRRFWVEYLRTHDMDGTALVTNLTVLRRQQAFRDIEELLRAYLANRRAKNPAPWLYELLALTIEMNKGRPEDVRKALGFAADQAMKSHLPVDLTRVADQLAMRGVYDRAGELLDRAVEMEPGSPKPLIMSINLALRSKDPARMGKTVESFLSLGWPKQDEIWRLDVRNQAEALAKTLREDGRSPEADELLERLASAESRDLVIRLTWEGNAGLDLVVEEPLGASAHALAPRTVFGGALVKDGHGKHPEDVYVCPRAFDGAYKIRVNELYNDEKAPVREATIEVITNEGTPKEKTTTHTVRVNASEPLVVQLTGGRRTKVLPYQAPAPEPTFEPAATPTEPSSSSPSSAADALRAPSDPTTTVPRGIR